MYKFFRFANGQKSNMKEKANYPKKKNNNNNKRKIDLFLAFRRKAKMCFNQKLQDDRREKYGVKRNQGLQKKKNIACIK